MVNCGKSCPLPYHHIQKWFSYLYIFTILDPRHLSPRELTPSSSATATPSVTPTHGFESMETTPSKSGPPTPQLGSPTLMRQKSELGKRPYRRFGSMTEQPKVLQTVVAIYFYLFNAFLVCYQIYTCSSTFLEYFCKFQHHTNFHHL